MRPVKRQTMGAIAIGLASFILYMVTAGPALVPYRDAGEMTTTATTLGILHPTGYPLYSLLGHLSSRLPIGNAAYKLNLFSALAMAACWSFLYLFLSELAGSACAAIGAIGLGLLSFQFWAHALVAEMNTLNLLFLSAILYSLYRRQWYLAVFLSGLGLTNRVDLLLTFPALLVYGWRQWRQTTDKRPLSTILLVTAFAAGLSVYVYLPVRAGQGPWLNWNDPSDLDSLISTLTRQGYGGTLDLLSSSYQVGENFLSELRHYGVHLWNDFSGLGVIAALLGTIIAWRQDRSTFWMLLLGFLITGPLFIFIGNLPPNPHAVAIMESGYLMPDLFLLGFVSLGLAWFFRQHRFAWRWIFGLGLPVVLAWQGWGTSRVVSKRHNYLAVDFARNVYRSVPPSALVVGRSDVPIFSLFYGHWVYSNGVERWPLAQGLMARAWYLRMMRQQIPDIHFDALRDLSDWQRFSDMNPKRLVAATLDIDWPGNAGSLFQPKGLVAYVPKPGVEKAWHDFPASTLFELYSYRGLYQAEGYRDFFSEELIEAYAKAWMQAGEQAMRRNLFEEAETSFQKAFLFKRDLPYAAFQMAYMDFVRGRYAQADRRYELADHLLETLSRQAQDWKSLPPLPAQIRRDWAQEKAQWGVTKERMGFPDQARVLYEKALALDPSSADARYNLAVLAWKRADWPMAVEQLQTLAREHPEDARWKVYLPAAMAHLKSGQ